MNRNNSVIRAITSDEQIRIIYTDSTQATQEIRNAHDLAPLPTLLIGKLISAVAMMGSDLKNDDSEISVRIDGQGELEGGLCVVNGLGHIRAFAFNPLFDTDNLDLGKHLFPGTMSIIRYSKLKTPYTGHIELISGNIADDLAYYYQQSEQIPTAVNLGILIDSNAKVRSCGGYIIQQLPGADPSAIDLIIKNINQTPNVSDLMDMGLTIHEIMNQFVLKGIDWSILLAKQFEFRCNCSRERFQDALRLLGVSELKTLSDGIRPVCHYCNKQYEFSSEDIKSIINSL